MTKINFKAVLVPAVFALAFASFSPALAETDLSERGKKPEQARQEQKSTLTSCTRISAEAGNVQKTVSERRDRVVNNRTEKKQEIKTRHEERKDKVGERIDAAKANTDERLEKLSELAQTEEQRAAVEAFTTSMSAAREKRRSAVEAAMDVFRTGLEALQNTRKTTAEAAAAAFRTTVTTALEKAKSDCQLGALSAAEVKSALVASLRAAKAELDSQRIALDTKSNVEELVKTRNDAVRAAHSEFKATLQSEIAKLKAAFATLTDDSNAE
ncbi:MAG: hypothetical protein A3J48_03045 [Candidatus Doudnabacteria bacterium RIFCSPHIGHO2_02_FULL_46_11]|uniref:DUF5667 domain-containing protein n=1 Tax=Candidatus Doudnabacteria bacterium RIFCSPHIGHO2_02_FULL_46_11 TaxID=1817832 RepID=A0A1F5P5N6_9BACT|nr:MAG: hypothetical protein A3J48_03045 [Candidatus Doudnabacteria bacterium RIFCSPHIGHO2_02_FULL_46_11]